MVRAHGWWAAGVCAGTLLSGQEPVGPVTGDLTRLPLDELIQRLPAAGSEWIRGASWRLVPVAQELKDRIEHGAELSGDQWKRALLSTGAVRMRSRWPSSEPLAISMKEVGWLPCTRVRLEPRDATLAPVEAGWLNGPGFCGTYSSQVEQSWLYQVLGELPLGRQTLVLDLTLERGRPFRSRFAKADEGFVAPAGVFFRGTLSFDVEIVATADEAVPPRSSSELDAAVRRTLSLAFDDWAHGRAALLVVDPDVRDPALARLGLSLDIELRHGEELVQEMHLTASTYDPLCSSISVHEAPDQPFSFGVLGVLPIATEGDPAARAGWSARARGTSQHALQLWEADAYWSGEVRLSLDELIQREREVAPEGRGPWVYMPTFR